MPSGQLHGRLTGTRGITADVVDYAYNMSDEELVNWIRTLRDRAESIMQA
jgi:arsenate reductase-like glutaredoxin family protein